MPYLIFWGAVFLILVTLVLSYLAFKAPFGGGKYMTDPYEVKREDVRKKVEGMRPHIDFILSHEREEVRIRAKDGTELVADYFHVKDGAPIELGVHGYRSMGPHDLYGGGAEALRAGHNLLLIDQRAHGRSGGRAITFGALESHDVKSWAEYLVGRFGEDTRIILFGMSMGAATVLIASGLDLPRQVKGIIADCPCSYCWDILSSVGKRKGAPVWLFKPFVFLGARLFGKFKIKDTDVRVAVKRASVPILLIHGLSDDFVPAYMSEEIKAANDRITIALFKGATHVESYLSDTKRYVKLISEFKKEVLK